MTMHDVETIEAIFARDGVLAQALPGYEVRAEQVAFAQGLADALDAGEHFLGEAGTGTGKSLAYLVAVLAAGKKAVISTHTKALQDQLAHHDLPLARQLFAGATWAVLKGRQNYLCQLEMAKLDAHSSGAGGQLVFFSSQTEASTYGRLRHWLRSPEGDAARGDLDQLPFALPDDLRAQVTVDGQSCVGRKCPFFADCYSQRAKAAAEASQLVIVNHRLLMLDLALGEQTGGEVQLLPARQIIVLDEAHHLEAVATESFGAELTAGRWTSLARRVRRLGDETSTRLDGMHDRGPALESVERVVDLGETVSHVAQGWMDRLLTALGEAKAREVRLVLTPRLRGEGDQLAAMTTQLMLGLWDIGARVGAALTEAEAHEAERWKKAGGTAMRLHHWLVAALESAPREDPPFLRTVEREWGRSGERAVVQVRPLRVHEILERLLWSPRQVLAVSATLATPGGQGSDRFAYWRSRVGVQGGVTRVIASPFPYRARVRLYIPQEVARFDPTRPEVKGGDGLEAYRARLTARVAELLAVRRGGAFVLCTSLGMVRHLAPVLQTRDARVMIQGDAPPAELIRRFKADGQAILVGTRTFWEGVDVQGDALTMVLIDRLPFAVPDDPLWEAWVREAGETWFVDLALPMTLLALKQAFGRLMRRMDDWGVVGILDARVIGKSYGRWLLSGLPPAPVIRTVAEVKGFCQERSHRHPR
jgi:ATP-dependent DNA helicase DinG